MRNPGRLDQRVTLVRATTSRSASGGVTQAWSDVDEFWASVDPLEGTEALRGMQLSAKVTHRIRTYYRSDITARDRLRLGSRTFEIRSVINPGEHNATLEIYAEHVS